jgi:hypothetical protein
LDRDNKEARNISELKTHGEADGEIKDILKLRHKKMEMGFVECKRGLLL